MKWLLLAVLMDTLFGQAFKFGQRRGFAAPWVVGASYLSLGVCLSVFLIVRDTPVPPASVWIMGVSMGALFLPSMLIFNHALRRAPVGMVVTTFRMGIVLPMIIGVAIWNETLSLAQGMGVGLSMFALVLMTRGKAATSWLPARDLVGLLLLLFGMQGICYTMMRAVQYWGLGDHQVSILAIVGLTAGILGFGYAAFFGGPSQRVAVLFGGLIGAYNSITLPVIFTALSYLPGTQYFPLAACGAVILDNLCAHFVWRERLTAVNTVGVITALLSLVLIIE